MGITLTKIVEKYFLEALRDNSTATYKISSSQLITDKYDLINSFRECGEVSIIEEAESISIKVVSI